MTKPILRVFFDMDGVLSDFANAALIAHGAPDYFKENPDARGFQFWDLAENLGIKPKDFWAPLEHRDFWANLAPMADGFEMLYNVFMNYEAILYGLTLPYKSEGCYAGKFYWFMKHVSNTIPYSHLCMAKEKQLFARDKYCILVDDNNYNCECFKKAGGRAFLVGRPWNDRHWIEPLNAQAFSEFIGKVADEIELQAECGW